MNRQEYLNSKHVHNSYYKRVQYLLKEWKLENNITERCDVHHRDDSDECIKYNNDHYELWGFNEDGTFELGRYVQFMTATEHARYHHIGNKNHMYGKRVSEETKAKMSAAHKGENNHFYGKHHTNEARAKITAANLGRTLSEETKAKISTTLKGKKRSEENKAKLRAHMKAIKFLYDMYKRNGGNIKWNDFQKALATGDITFSDYAITVFK